MEVGSTKIFLSGRIRGDSNYREKFNKAQAELEAQGHIVMNPAVLPQGFPHEAYMPICFAMIDACEVINLIDDWEKSEGGVQAEIKYANDTMKNIWINGEPILVQF